MAVYEEQPPAVAASAERRGQGAVVRVLGSAIRTRRGQVGAALALAILLIAFAGPFLPNMSPTAFAAAPF